MLEVWHADSLAGPMMEMKKAFETRIPAATVHLTSGRSKELAERILKGEACDVFAPSDPAVVKEMFGKQVGDKAAASWYVVFSANEMVVITGKGNTLGIKRMTDLARSGVRLARVSGEKDMATNRTVQFITRAAAAEGKPDLSQKIIDEAARENTIPDVLKAVKSGKADAGIVYLSAAVTVADAEIIRFPAQLNLSENIRNVATVPGTAMNVKPAGSFIGFLLSAEGRQILQKTGQPPIVPPIKEGNVPLDISKE
ncbi:MAG: molybdate ABC transporter substrate-binding protein [Deltaproteobacteria bacterium]|nr:molybdate ABC transporter substrate-binding protein [Deltaproteobacteria bacterium]